jgi:hypothetical protein
MKNVVGYAAMKLGLFNWNYHQVSEEGHGVGWSEARILKIETNSKYRKYKELALMAGLTNPT